MGVVTTLFYTLLQLANDNKKEEDITDMDLIALIYKYWYAECSEQELHEDLSYLVDWDTIPTIIEGIRDLNPDTFTGTLAKKYMEYYVAISEEGVDVDD